MFETIVVGYDGSDPSVRALETACELAVIHHGAVHVVHTPEPIWSEFADVTFVTPEATQAIKDATGIAQTMGVALASAVIGGSAPVDDILQIADAHDAKLIVSGRRGLGRVSGAMLGSTSQKLAQLATCPCMTVA